MNGFRTEKTAYNNGCLYKWFSFKLGLTVKDKPTSIVLTVLGETDYRIIRGCLEI